MKKFLALAVVIMMVLPMCFMFVSAEEVTVDEEITVDGILDDTGWMDETVWNTTDGETGYFQEGSTESDFSYDWAVRIDADKIYFAVNVSKAPEVLEGDAALVTRSNTRFLFNNGTAASFDYIIDFMYDGTVFADFRDPTSATAIAATAYDFEYVVNDDSYVIEVAFNLADLGYSDEKDFSYFITVSDPSAGDVTDPPKANGLYEALHMNDYTVGNEEGEGNNTYAPWSTPKHYNVIAKDDENLVLGQYTYDDESGETSEPTEEEIAKELLGEENELGDNAIELIFDANDYDAENDIIKLVVTLADEEELDWTALVQFQLFWDKDFATLVYFDEENEEYVPVESGLDISAVTKGPGSGQQAWEALCVFDAEEDFMQVDVGGVQKSAGTIASKGLELTFYFQVKEGIEDDIWFWAPHASVNAATWESSTELFPGTGAYAISSFIVEEPSSEPSSEAPSSDDSSKPVGPGDAGSMVIIILAVVALAGAGALVVNKRR